MQMGPGTEGEAETPGPSGLSLTFHPCLLGCQFDRFISCDLPLLPRCQKRKRLLPAAPRKKEKVYTPHSFSISKLIGKASGCPGLGWCSTFRPTKSGKESRHHLRTGQLDVIRFMGKGSQFQRSTSGWRR